METTSNDLMPRYDSKNTMFTLEVILLKYIFQAKGSYVCMVIFKLEN